MATHYPQARPAAPPLSISEPKALYLEIRHSTALACALDAMAQQALDEGEFPAEQLDHLSALTARLRSDLEEIKALFAEQNAGGQHE
jgi:hypothetical protein